MHFLSGWGRDSAKMEKVLKGMTGSEDLGQLASEQLKQLEIKLETHNKWGTHDPETQNRLQERAEQIREENNLTTKVQRKKNISFAYYSINKYTEDIKAISGSEKPGFTNGPEEGANHFEPTPDEPNPDGSPGNPRDTDTEYKILEKIADDHWSDDPAERAKVTGDVYLYTERSPCDSCTDVIRQFKEAFPHVNVHVEWGPK